MTIDCAVGEVFDKASTQFKKYEKVLRSEDAQQEFIDKYNKRMGKEVIPKDYFQSFINDEKMARGHYIEMLGRYGNPGEVELPMGLKSDQNADMSFTGLKTAILSRFHQQSEDRSIPLYERERKDLNFEQLLGYAASIQYAILAPCRNKLDLSLRWLKNRDIPFNAIQLSGGVSCNGELRRLVSEVAEKYQVPLVYSEPKYCTDNAAMIAWMGWELLNAE